MLNPPFPFVQGRAHSVGELRAFETALAEARQQDADLSKSWRVPKSKEMKEWCKIREETYPIKLLADRLNVSDDDTFRLMPYGHPDIDAEIMLSDEQFDLQITIADPVWMNESGSRQNGGYDHRLVMEALNQSGMVHGSACMKREGGRIVSGLPVKSYEQEFEGCRQGLVEAIRRKLGRGSRKCRLLVHARGYEIHTMDFSLEDVARSAIESLKTEIAQSRFTVIYVVNQDRLTDWFTPRVNALTVRGITSSSRSRD